MSSTKPMLFVKNGRKAGNMKRGYKRKIAMALVPLPKANSRAHIIIAYNNHTTILEAHTTVIKSFVFLENSENLNGMNA